MEDNLTSFPGIPINETKEKQKSYLDLRYGPVPVPHGKACARVGIHRNTPLMWRRIDPEYQVEESLRQQAKREDDLSELQEQQAESADLVTGTGEKMLKGLLISMADKDGTLSPQALAAMARDEDAVRGLGEARKMILDGAKLKRVSRDLPANGPGDGVRVGVAVNATSTSAAASMSTSAAAAAIAPLTPDEKADRLRAIIAAKKTAAGGPGKSGGNGNNGNGPSGKANLS